MFLFMDGGGTFGFRIQVEDQLWCHFSPIWNCERLDGFRVNDPHVEALLYKVAHSDGVNFDEAELLEFETSQFIARVENGTARFDLKAHYGSVKEARTAIEPFIRVWEVWDALNPLSSGFRLVYSTAEVIDRNPPPGNYGCQTLPAIRMSGHGAVSNAFRCYPEPPPEQAALDANIEVMAYRHWLYRQGRDTLGAMAYFCLTVLEDSAGSGRAKRKRAARRYNVDEAVLRKLGELTEGRGGRDARKGKGVSQDFTPSERMWIELIIKRLIRRAADLAENPGRDLPLIT